MQLRGPHGEVVADVEVLRRFQFLGYTFAVHRAAFSDKPLRCAVSEESTGFAAIAGDFPTVGLAHRRAMERLVRYKDVVEDTIEQARRRIPASQQTVA